jgi:hypothetical protein
MFQPFGQKFFADCNTLLSVCVDFLHDPPPPSPTPGQGPAKEVQKVAQLISYLVLILLSGNAVYSLGKQLLPINLQA